MNPDLWLRRRFAPISPKSSPSVRVGTFADGGIGGIWGFGLRIYPSFTIGVLNGAAQLSPCGGSSFGVTIERGRLGETHLGPAHLGSLAGRGATVEPSTSGARAFGVRCDCGGLGACRLRYRRHAGR